MIFSKVLKNVRDATNKADILINGFHDSGLYPFNTDVIDSWNFAPSQCLQSHQHLSLNEMKTLIIMLLLKPRMKSSPLPKHPQDGSNDMFAASSKPALSTRSLNMPSSSSCESPVA